MQVQYVYHCCLCLIFDQITMAQEQTYLLVRFGATTLCHKRLLGQSRTTCNFFKEMKSLPNLALEFRNLVAFIQLKLALANYLHFFSVVLSVVFN